MSCTEKKLQEQSNTLQCPVHCGTTPRVWQKSSVAWNTQWKIKVSTLKCNECHVAKRLHDMQGSAVWHMMCLLEKDKVVNFFYGPCRLIKIKVTWGGRLDRMAQCMCQIGNKEMLHIWPITGSKVGFCFSEVHCTLHSAPDNDAQPSITETYIAVQSKVSWVQWSEMQRTPINCGHALWQLF